MNHLIRQLQITEALAHTVSERDHTIERLEREARDRERRQRGIISDKETAERIADERFSKIEELEKEKEAITLRYTAELTKKDVRLLIEERVKTTYYRKKLRRLEDRIRRARAYGSCEAANILSDYQEAERKRRK
jgi:hypothetical protein